MDKIKALILSIWSVFLQKSHHLLQELSDDPKGGFFWWLKTHQQKVALDKALEELRQESRKPHFQLNRVSQILLSFKLKKDDAGQAEWYQDAHEQLISCQKRLEDASILKTEMIKPALTELRFISEADKFHEYFQLQPLQRRVRNMYEAITERLDVLLEDTKHKNQQHKQELEVRKKEAEVLQANELSRQEELKLQQEQAAVKKLETERDLVDHQRDAEEEVWKREEADRQLRIQESQQQHRLDIQESLVGLQIEENGTINEGDTPPLKALLQQIKNKQLNRSDPKIKEQLQELLQEIVDL